MTPFAFYVDLFWAFSERTVKFHVSSLLAKFRVHGPTDRAPTYGSGIGPALAPATWLKVNGKIVFHIIDAESKKVV